MLILALTAIYGFNSVGFNSHLSTASRPITTLYLFPVRRDSLPNLEIK